MSNLWYLKSIKQERTGTGEKFTLVTDRPCHLWMRWTLIEPRIHRVPITRRGLTTMNDLYFCFDAYTDNEQQEEGDTLIHTFIKEPWPYCEKRWFYFHGEINGTPSPSTTAIFHKHPPRPKYLYELHCYPITLGADVACWYKGYYIASNFKPSTPFLVGKLGAFVCLNNIREATHPIMLSIREATSQGYPSENDLTSGYIDMRETPSGQYDWRETIVSPYQPKAGQRYAFVVWLPCVQQTPPYPTMCVHFFDEATCDPAYIYWWQYSFDCEATWQPWQSAGDYGPAYRIYEAI